MPGKHTFAPHSLSFSSHISLIYDSKLCGGKKKRRRKAEQKEKKQKKHGKRRRWQNKNVNTSK